MGAPPLLPFIGFMSLIFLAANCAALARGGPPSMLIYLYPTRYSCYKVSGDSTVVDRCPKTRELEDAKRRMLE